LVQIGCGSAGLVFLAPEAGKASTHVYQLRLSWRLSNQRKRRVDRWPRDASPTTYPRRW